MLKTAEQIAFEVLRKEAGLLTPIGNFFRRRGLAKLTAGNPAVAEREALKHQRAVILAQQAAEKETLMAQRQAELAAARGGKAAPAAAGAPGAPNPDVTVGHSPEVTVGAPAGEAAKDVPEKGLLGGLKGIALASGLGLGGGYLLANSKTPQDQGYPPPGYGV
jgi:hypothetical protein